MVNDGYKWRSNHWNFVPLLKLVVPVILSVHARLLLRACCDSITQRHPRGATASTIALNLGIRNCGTRPLPSSQTFATWRHLIRAVIKLGNYDTDSSRAGTPFALTCFLARFASELFRPEDDGSTLLRNVSNDVLAGITKRRRKLVSLSAPVWEPVTSRCSRHCRACSIVTTLTGCVLGVTQI